MTNNFAVYSIKIIIEIFKDILMFPFWWYSRGLINTFLKLVNFIKNKEKVLGISIWIKNIFRPMYGQTDWQGKLISIFIRLMQIIFRSIVLLFWILIAVILLACWIALPIVIIYEIFFQLNFNF